MMFIALVLLPLIAAQVDAANGTTAANAIPSGPANSGNDTTVGSPNGAPNGTAGGSSPATGALLSADTRAYLDAALKRWDIPGAAVVVVAGPPYTNKTGEDGWATEYYNYGRANAVGDPVTQDVSSPTLQADRRLSSRSPRTPSSSQPSARAPSWPRRT